MFSYLIPDPVVEYIDEHGLFQDGLGKEKAAADGPSRSATPQATKG